MHEVLNKNVFLVKEHVGMFKAANNYDIYDPATNEIIMECREEKLGFLTRMLRFSNWKTKTSFDVQIRTPQGQPVVRVTRGFTFFRSKVRVLNEKDEPIGTFRQKIFSIGGAFTVLDRDEKPVCELKGKWTGWDFRFMAEGVELAHVTKKWAGIGKELFTSADNYVIEMSDKVPPNNPIRQLIIAAVICIDMVLKEEN